MNMVHGYQSRIIATALSSPSASVEMPAGLEDLGDRPPFETVGPETFSFRVLPGSPAGETIGLAFQ